MVTMLYTFILNTHLIQVHKNWKARYTPDPLNLYHTGALGQISVPNNTRLKMFLFEYLLRNIQILKMYY